MKPARRVSPDSSAIEAAVPTEVLAVIERFVDAGHAAYVVGGSLRDVLLGRDPADWDLASDAVPERVLDLFPTAVYENRFGTVAVRAGEHLFEITTFRTDHEYADFRRPHRIEFGTDLAADLARRDFTVNAMAWGRAPGDDGPALVDPYEGRRDLERRLLRAVGDPDARFREDALRMLRGMRLAAAVELTVEPATLAAVARNADLARHLSGERIGMELEKLLATPRPSVGLELLQTTGLLGVIAPDLARQRGVPQNKVPGEDLWDHTLRSVDAAPAGRPVVRLAALVHDIGKPATFQDGRFHGHETVGAQLATAFLRRLRYPRSVTERVAHLVAHHMFTVDPTYSDAAIRRFILRIGEEALEDLFALREADDAGSGKPSGDPELAAFRARVHAELTAAHALARGNLAIDGHDLQRELGLEPGPRLGRILDFLLERVIEDPTRNDAPTLLLLAQAMLADRAER